MKNSARLADRASKSKTPPAVFLLTDPGGYFTKFMSRYGGYIEGKALREQRGQFRVVDGSQ